MKGKVLGVLAVVFACMLLALPFAAAVPEEESTVPVLMDNGDGSTEWGEAPVSGTVSDVIEAAFPGTVFSWTGEITVDGTGSVITGGADSGGSYTEPGATGNSTTAFWKVYSWNGSAWEGTSPSSACTGPVAIGLYPDGFVPTETPDHRTSWTMIRGDSAQTGAADAEFSSTEPSSVKWTDRGSAYAAMLHAGGYVFVKYGCGTDLRASVVCYELETGDKVWEFTYPGISNYETGAPAIVGDTIYIPSALGYVFSFDWRAGPGTLDASNGTYSGEVMMTDATGSPRAYSDGDVEERVGAIPNSTATLEGTTYNAGNTSIVYDRAGSSINRIRLEEIPEEVYTDTRMFHTSGISLALSEQTRQVCLQLIKNFKAGGASISFDVNYRANLWDEDTARATIQQVLPYVDVLFVSEETSRRMFQKTGDLQDILKSYCTEYGVRVVASTQRTVISPKKHDFTSLIYAAESDRFYTEAPYTDIDVVDRVGSGDAYVAGVLFGMLKYGDPQKALEFGNATSSVKNTIPGDLPSSDFKEISGIIRAHNATGPQSELNR